MNTSTLKNKAKRAVLLLLLALLSASTVWGQETTTISIGENNSSFDSNLPFRFGIDYSLTQQIYTSDEIGMPGFITAISFYCKTIYDFHVGNYFNERVEIYLKHTNQDGFESESDMVPVSSSDLVYDGYFEIGYYNMPMEGWEGWVTLTLDTPFPYDGTRNLLVCCYDPNNFYRGENIVSLTSNNNSYTQQYTYSSISFFDNVYFSLDSPDNTDLDLNTYRSTIQFNIQPNNTPQPLNLTASDVTDISARLTWEAPITNEPVTGYSYQYKESSDNWIYIEDEYITSDTFVSLNVMYDKYYQFRVRTLYENTASDYVYTNFHTYAIYLPNLTVSNVTDCQATLTWNAPETAFTLTGYAYTYTQANSGVWNGGNTTNTTVTLTGLEGGTRYLFYAKALFSDHDSPYYQSAIGFTTLAITLPNLAVSEITDQSATLTWEVPETPYTITGYTYQYKKTTDAGWSAEITTTDTFAALSGLSGGTEYQFRAKVLFSDHEGTYTDIGFTTLAITLPNLAVSEITDQSATLTWEAPETPYTITGYAYQYKETTDADWSIETINSNTSVTLSGLSNLTEYQFRAKVLFSDHEGVYTNIGFTTTISLPYECGFENGMDGWSMVDVNTGSGITTEYHHSGGRGFRFLGFFSGEHDPQYLISPPFTSTETLVISFYHYNCSGTISHFQIGYSTTSNDPAAFTWIEEITPSYHTWVYYEHTFPAGTIYVAIRFHYVDSEHAHYIAFDDFYFREYSPYPVPTSLTVSNLTDQSATLMWTAPNTDQTVTGYAYQYKRAADAAWSAETTVNATSVTLNGLSINTTYDFRVKALYEGGNASNYTTVFKFLTENVMESLPHYQGFEDGMGGWRIVDGHPNTGIPGITVNRYTVDCIHTGDRGFRFHYGSETPPQYLISPQFDGSSAILASFYYINYSYTENGHINSYTAGFQVGYSTTNKNLDAFTWGDTITSSHQWQQYSEVFPIGTKYVAVKWIDGYYLFLDDFSLENPCDEITVDPSYSLTENFESDVFPPLCWDNPSIFEENITKQWMRSTSCSHSSNASAYCSYSGHNYYLKMPSFYLAENADKARLTFWSMHRPSASNNYGNCSVVLIDGNNETELWTSDVTSIQEDVWYETNIDLAAYTGQNISLAFKYEGNISSYWYVDDVEVSVPWLGNGTEQNPYLITTTEQLERLAEWVNNGNDFNGKYFRLANDLNYNNTANNHTPIGNGSYRFLGTFDGNGHTISGIRISGSDSYLGVFGGCNGGMVKNLTLTDAQISGDSRVGGIVGDNYLGTVENCHVTNSTLSGSGQYIGGAVGWNDRGTLSGNTVFFTTVSAGGGAILGTNQNGTLNYNFYFNCTVDGVADATNVGTDSGDITTHYGAAHGIWKEDFQSYNYNQNIVPIGWDNSASTSSTLSSEPEYLWGVYYDQGNEMLRMLNHYVQTGTAIINTPMIVLPSEETIELLFYYSHRASCGPFTVKISVDGGATFVNLASYDITSSYKWQTPGEFTKTRILLTEYAGQTVMLQFYAEADNGDGAIFVDNIEIRPAPTCTFPINLGTNNITAFSAQLSWTANSGENEWTVYYKKATDNDFTEVTGVTDNTYTLEGLRPDKDYECYVVANCTADDASEPSNMHYFHTECDVISSFPWIEDFESYDNSAIPNCWDNSASTAQGYSSAYIWDIRVFGGNKMIVMDNHMSSGTALINTPVIVLPSDEAFDLYFNYSHRASCDPMKVKISVDGGATFVELASFGNLTSTISADDPGEFIRVLVPLAEYAGQSVIIQFYAEPRYEIYYGEGAIFVDDVEVSASSECRIPTSLFAYNITNNTAELNWEANNGETEWTVCYKKATDSNYTTLTGVTDNPYTLEGLTGITDYDCYVVAHCSANSTSEPSKTLRFSTADPLTVTAESPFIEDFESYTGAYDNYQLPHVLPPYWDAANLQNTNQPNYTTYLPHILAAHSGSNYYNFDDSQVLYFSVHSDNCDIFAALPRFTNPLNQLQISFRYGIQTLGETLTLGYITDEDENYNTFTAIQGFTVTGYFDVESMHQAAPIDLIELPANAARLVFHTNFSSVTHCHIDDVVVSLTPCSAPTALGADNITASSATLYWTANGGESEWSVYYKKATDNDFTEVTDVTDIPYTLEGLRPGTDYEYYVVAHCSADAASNPSRTFSFTTTCDVSFPWSEDFEKYDIDSTPNCWDNSASTSPTLGYDPQYIWGVYRYQGNKMLCMNNYEAESGSALINTPTITLPSDGITCLRFDYSHDASCGPLTVKISEDDGATFVDLKSFNNDDASYSYYHPEGFVGASIPLTAYAGKSVIVQFYANANYDDGAIFVDNVEIGNLSVNGNEYTINDAAGWNLFCDALQDNDTYNRFYGKTVKLGADITVTRMAGSSGHDFKGTFDGQGHTLTLAYGTTGNPLSEEYAAPFRYVENGAHIHSLNVDGHIYTSNKYAGGIVGCQWGTVSVSNCRSGVIIHSSKSGDGTHSGIVANQRGGALTVSGCVFDGRMLTTNGTTQCSGLVGYHNNGTCTISDCLYTPADVTLAEGETYITDGATFCRNYSGTPANCYYTEALGEAQGQLAYSITSEDVVPAFAGEATEYDVSGLTTCGTGLQYGNILYAGHEEEVSLTLMMTAGFSVGAATYTPEGGTAAELTPVNEVYSFTMPDANVIIDATEYLILSATEWDHFCDALEDNDTWNRFIGKTVKLGADITVTRMAGSSTHDFMGTFDGQGHTLTLAFGTAESPVSEEYAAPFRNVENGCVIENLHVDGTITTANKFAAGIVAQQYGAVTIRNCRSSVTIQSSVEGDGTHGGLVGIKGNSNNANLTIEGCTFDGKIVSTGTTATTLCGGFVGWRSNSGSLTITNSLYAPTADNNAVSSGATFARNWTMPDDANCYYTETMGTAQGQLVLSSPAASPVGEAIATYDVSGLTFYSNGVLFGEVFYYNPANTFTHVIAGYGEGTDGWNLIASPLLGETSPEAVAGMTDNAFDLYRFNPTADLEWENWKKEGEHYHFGLENGRGYLYASQEGTTLTFSGEFNTDAEKTLSDLPQGYNLVGNPFIVNAYVNKPYYTLDESGSVVVATQVPTTTAIRPCNGIIVEVTEASPTVVFSTSVPEAANNNGGLQIALEQTSTRGNALLDNAIVSFNEGEQLGKFYFGEQNANIYLPQNGKDFSIAFSEKQGEMPVNFKAKESGSYTISVNPEGVELAYLHLIDNLTGADVDLLHPNAVIAGEDPQSPTPMYTFQAKTTDYESRFRLVFVAKDGPSTGSGTYAFISDGNIIITADGALQVIDMMGRVIVSRSENTRYVSTAGMTPGVYVLRLINGNEVKVQKIVVE